MLFHSSKMFYRDSVKMETFLKSDGTELSEFLRKHAPFTFLMFQESGSFS